MHCVNNHHERSQYLASDYLNILITYLRSLPNCSKHLQNIFTQYASNGTNRLHIDEFENLLSVLIIEACNNSGHNTPDNTELTVSYILNILIQINSNINHNVTSQINIEFSKHFITHLLKHLLSLKNKETPKPDNNNRLKKYKKAVSNPTHSFRINRRSTINDHNKTHRNKSKSRSRSKSIDLITNHNEIDHVLLVTSPSNSLVMTENILFKYQKNNKNNHNNTNKLYHHSIPQNHHFSSRLFPIQSKHTTLHNTLHNRSHYNGYNNNMKTKNNNIISIERIPYHGNGSPSDSTSKSSHKSHKSNKKSYKKSKHNKHRKKTNKMDEININNIHKQIKLKPTQRGVQISRRRTENNLLAISRKPYKNNDSSDSESESDNESESGSEESIHLDLNNDNLMLDLLTEISDLQREYKQSKQSYTNKIYDLEYKLATVQSENTLMQHQLRLYEQRIAQMERLINSNQTYHQIQHYNSNSNNSNNNNNVSVISNSSSSSNISHSTSLSNSSNKSRQNTMDTSYSSSVTSNKYRALEKKLHLKILRQRENELKSSLNSKTRKNASLTRKKKQNNTCKKFEPIELQNNVILNDNNNNTQIKINPNINEISIPIIIDESKTKPIIPHHHHDHHHKRKNGSYQSAISALSGNKNNNNANNNESSDSSQSEIIIVVNDSNNIDENDSKENDLYKHKNTILSALQQAVAKQTEKEKQKQIEMDNNSSISSSDHSSISSSDSEYFNLFNDNYNSTEYDSGCDDYKMKPKYTDLINVPIIKIPKSEKDLLKKVKPAYKYHLEMIDHDGSIAFEIEQRKKRRDREKKQQHMKQLYSTRQQQQYNHKHKHRQRYNNSNNNKHIRMCYFENKPLGFQINESPECIFVTNVYNDRGTAYEKGIERGWKIIEVNKQNNVKGMMEKLRNNKGPFSITFDTVGLTRNY